MLIVDVIFWAEIEPLKLKTICRLAWDDRLKRIVILKGKRIGREILKDRYLDKRFYPKRLKYISATQGKKFIEDLCFGLTGSRCWASQAYRKEFE